MPAVGGPIARVTEAWTNADGGR